MEVDPDYSAKAAAIAKTWKNPLIAARRSRRHRVRVNGKVFRSMPSACECLRLSLAGMQRARRTLVSEGVVVFRGVEFRRVPDEA